MKKLKLFVASVLITTNVFALDYSNCLLHMDYPEINVSSTGKVLTDIKPTTYKNEKTGQTREVYVIEGYLDMGVGQKKKKAKKKYTVIRDKKGRIIEFSGTLHDPTKEIYAGYRNSQKRSNLVHSDELVKGGIDQLFKKDGKKEKMVKVVGMPVQNTKKFIYKNNKCILNSDVNKVMVDFKSDKAVFEAEVDFSQRQCPKLLALAKKHDRLLKWLREKISDGDLNKEINQLVYDKNYYTTPANLADHSLRNASSDIQMSSIRESVKQCELNQVIPTGSKPRSKTGSGGAVGN